MLSAFSISFVSITKIMFVLGSGILLFIFKYISRNASTGLGSIATYIVLPMLIFSYVLKSFNVADVSIWLTILVVASLERVIGYGIGVVACKIFNIKEEKRNVSIGTLMFPNSTSFQLILMESMAPFLGQLKPLRPVIFYESVLDRGNYYIVLTTIVALCWVWSAGTLIIKDPYTRVSLKSKIINPPIIWSVATISFTLIPYLRDWIFPSQSYMENLLIDSAIAFGKAAPFIMLFTAGINLGSNFIQMKSDEIEIKPMKTWKAVSLTIIRLVLMPIIGFGIIYPLYYWGIIVDPILVLILQLQFTTPACINLLIISNQNKFCVL